MTMKILYVCSDSGIPVLGRKGASVHVRSLASALTRAGHSVVVTTPLLSKSPWEPPATLDAQVLHVPASDALAATVDSIRSYTDAVGTSGTLPGEMRRILYNQQLQDRLVRRFKDDPPDFVYERAAIYSTAGVVVARALAVPLVLELNAPLGLEQATYRGSDLAGLAREAEHASLSGADVVVVVSAPLRDYVLGMAVQPERVHVLPNGVDDELFVPAERSALVRTRWGLGEGPIVGFVGGLRPWHGVRALPALLERLVASDPDVQMVIAGDGPLRRELSEGFAHRRLTAHTVFTGAVAHQDIPDLVRCFDVALAPYEPSDHLFYFSPLKLFEYMGCGVPVVAASLGQIRDVVVPDETGVLYAPGDLAELTDACRRLFADPARRERIGRAAAAAVHRQFTWKQNARRVIELVERTTRATEVAA